MDSPFTENSESIATGAPDAEKPDVHVEDPRTEQELPIRAELEMVKSPLATVRFPLAIETAAPRLVDDLTESVPSKIVEDRCLETPRISRDPVTELEAIRFNGPHTDKELPELICRAIEIDDANRTCPATESELPRVTRLPEEMEPEQHAAEATENVLPTNASKLMDRASFIRTVLESDVWFATVRHPVKDKEPSPFTEDATESGPEITLKFDTLKAEPKATMSFTEAAEVDIRGLRVDIPPLMARPDIERDLSKRAGDAIEAVDSTTRGPKTETDFPQFWLSRIETEPAETESPPKDIYEPTFADFLTESLSRV